MKKRVFSRGLVSLFSIFLVLALLMPFGDFTEQVYGEDGIILNSPEDLKAKLKEDTITIKLGNDDIQQKVFVLESGNYILGQSFKLDLKDKFFADKKELIDSGIISVMGDFNLDGKGNSITIKNSEDKNPLPALFGDIGSLDKKVGGSIKNINITYDGDVSGYTLARDIYGAEKTKVDGLKQTGFLVGQEKDPVNINVMGDVKPKMAIGKMTTSSDHIGQYKGISSSGLIQSHYSTSFNNININISGNIGDENILPEDKGGISGAFGLMFDFGSIHYGKDSPEWNALHNENKYIILRDLGHIENVNLNVEGSIVAHGYDVSYADGAGYEMGNAWIDNLNINVAGDIKSLMDGSGTSEFSASMPHASGFSDEIMNLTNSSLKVNNVVVNRENSDGGESPSYIFASGIGDNNSKGNYINISDNDINIKGKLEVISPFDANCTFGFMNNWNSGGSDGVNWSQFYQNNKFNIGSINAQSTEEGQVIYSGFTYRFRTGINPIGTATIPEASLKGNIANIGDVNISSKEGNAYAAGMAYNASNARGNTLNMGNYTVKGKKVTALGFGALISSAPEVNVYSAVAENNHITIKDFVVEGDDVSYASTYAGYHDHDQELTGGSVKVNSMDVNLIKGTKNSFIGGISAFTKGKTKNMRADIGEVNIKGRNTGFTYFGLGLPYTTNNSIDDVGVFVDKDINIDLDGYLLGGGVIGLASKANLKNMDFQLDGKNQIKYSNGFYGGFVGRLLDTELSNSSSLLLNDYAPFATFVNKGRIDNVSHYVNKPAPSENWYGLLMTADKYITTITNSTLLVEADNEKLPLYNKNSVTDESGNNYITVVDRKKDGFNRKAFKTQEKDDLIVKSEDLVGKINIAQRSFQDKYWNDKLEPYEVGEEESTFKYVSNSNGITLIPIGKDSKEVLKDGVESGKLANYYDRHVGVQSDKGPTYDLLGIKAFDLFTVRYEGNDNDGGKVPEDLNKYISGDVVKVQEPENLSKENYIFKSWNTSKDGTGTKYNPKDSFNIFEDTILYAQWEKGVGKVDVLKTDQDGTPLEGAIFKIVGSDGKTAESIDGNLLENFKSSKNGKLLLGETELKDIGIFAGDYKLIEMEAPEGYKISEEIVLKIETDKLKEIRVINEKIAEEAPLINQPTKPIKPVKEEKNIREKAPKTRDNSQILLNLIFLEVTIALLLVLIKNSHTKEKQL